MSAAESSSAIVRTTPCPRCAAAVGLTADQLEDKRGTCTACAASFELEPDTPLTDVAPGPALALDRVLALRPSGALRVQSRLPLSIVVPVPGMSVGMMFAFIVAMVCGLLGWTALGVANLTALPLLVVAAAAIAFGLWLGPRSYRLVATPGQLARRRLRGTRALPVTEPLALTTEGALEARSGEQVLPLGTGAGLTADDRRWLADVLRAATDRSRR